MPCACSRNLKHKGVNRMRSNNCQHLRFSSHRGRERFEGMAPAALFGTVVKRMRDVVSLGQRGSFPVVFASPKFSEEGAYV